MSDSRDLRDSRLESIAEQRRLEEYLENSYERLENNYSGLRDLDISFGLISSRFEIAITAIRAVSSGSYTTEKMRNLYNLAAEKSRAGLELFEELIHEAEENAFRQEVEQHEGFKRAREQLDQIILFGGGAFFTGEKSAESDSHRIAHAITASVRKYRDRDDQYEPLVRPERLPEPLRRVFSTLFYRLVPEGRKEPPYGIEEGEEEQVKSDRMVLPLSQAVHYYEHELIPRAEEQLRNDPGNSDLKDKLDQLLDQVWKFKQMKFIPRSSPIVLPHDYYTEGLVQYNEDGELLVPIDLPVERSSGTNLDRAMDLIRDDLTRRLAGTGACAKRDKELENLRRLETGRRGSSLFPRSKLNTRRGFRMLKKRIPAIKMLEDKSIVAKLLEEADSLSAGEARRLIEKRLERRRMEPKNIEPGKRRGGEE